MKNFTATDAAALVIWLLPIAYLLYVYSSLPVSVPLHYGLNGNADRYGTKGEFVLSQMVLIAVSGGIYLLFKFLPAIDPKKAVKYGEAGFKKLAIGIVFFMAALSFAIIFATANKGFKIDKLILPVVSLLFAFIGNIMNSIKPNYFAGIRTPWALENDDNWRYTHRLAGKLWFTGGILLTIAVLLLPAKASLTVFIGTTAVLTLVPFIYSYLYFKKHQVK